MDVSRVGESMSVLFVSDSATVVSDSSVVVSGSTVVVTSSSVNDGTSVTDSPLVFETTQ